MVFGFPSLRWLRICPQCKRHGFAPWVGKNPGEGNGYPLQYSCLGNPMDRGAWQTKVHGIGASQVGLGVKNPPANIGDVKDVVSFPGEEDPLEEDMATHSKILAWRISWTEEPGGLQSTGLQRVGHN